MNMNTRTLYIGIGSLVLLVVCAAGYYFFDVRARHLSAHNAPSSLAEVLPTTVHEGAPGEGMVAYTSAKYHFSLQYPQELTVKEYNESGGAMSATFQDAQQEKEFQIYVTPYADTQVTEARFKLDEPSGVRNEPVDVMIDGVRGTIFFSKNSILGDTREVWFINKGFLYEVVTDKELDAWLGDIMKSWKFTS